MPRRREERGLRSGGTVTRSAHVMSSRIRGRRYRNVDPDERYGFTVGTTAGAPTGVEPEDATAVIEVIAIDGTPLEGATVTMDGTSVTVGPPTPTVGPAVVALQPDDVAGSPRAAG